MSHHTVSSYVPFEIPIVQLHELQGQKWHLVHKVAASAAFCPDIACEALLKI